MYTCKYANDLSLNKNFILLWKTVLFYKCCRIAHQYTEHGHYNIQLHDCLLVAETDGDNAFLRELICNNILYVTHTKIDVNTLLDRIKILQVFSKHNSFKNIEGLTSADF